MYNFTEFWMGIQRMVRLYEKMMREVCDGYRLSMVEVDIIAFLKTIRRRIQRRTLLN
ncbi:MAG: hypothetical protein ACLUUO_15650 [Sellimonas intestinalis]